MMTDAELYREAVRLSGLASRKFATLITWHDERTARRWSEGKPMNELVRENLQWFVSLPPKKRVALVSLISRR